MVADVGGVKAVRMTRAFKGIHSLGDRALLHEIGQRNAARKGRERDGR